MSTSKIFWSGGLDRSLGLALPSGGLLDLQSLVYAWIFNSTGAYELPEPQALSSCGCVDPQGQATEDLLQCNSSALFGVALRSLTPAWVGESPGPGPKRERAVCAGGGCLGRLSSLLPVSVREVPFPTPAYTQDPFAKFVESVFGLFFVLVFIWPLTRIMKSLVEDKEARRLQNEDFHVVKNMFLSSPLGFKGNRFHCRKHIFLYFFQGTPQNAVGQNQWYHFGIGAPPILEPILVVGS
ncbi:unnamed protein product [Effrenium voratum]|uniref:Uncharacterized protein n=1 Tax=Effrenium voratum TaxID=2562239 RepID=A0AA36N295_9DINO|nr:unnamed protein product [Effrenium voratum]